MAFGSREFGVSSVIGIVVMIGLFAAIERGPRYWAQYNAPDKLHRVLARTESYAEARPLYERFITELHREIAPRCHLSRRDVGGPSARQYRKYFCQQTYNRQMVDGLMTMAARDERNDLYLELLNLAIEMRR